MSDTIYRCVKCSHLKDLSEFYFSGIKRIRSCKSCMKQYSKSRASSSMKKGSKPRDPRRRLLETSKDSAAKKSLEHTIIVEDIPIPKFCRYLGVKLDWGTPASRGSKRTPDTASIDRIDPTKGYVPGNIQVISDLANRMKSNATMEQLVQFAKGVLKEHS